MSDSVFPVILGTAPLRGKVGIEVTVSISESFSSALLKDLFTVCSPEMSDALDLAFPDMTEVLDFFDHSFDHDRAIEQGIIMPQPGIDSELDQISSDLQETQDDLDQYLEDIRSRFHCP